MKWKEIYEENKKRRCTEITGIKKEDVGIECNSLNYLKEKKYYIIAFNIILILILTFTFYKELKVYLIVLLFLLITEISFFALNSYTIICKKEGLYIKFGLQKGIFDYSRVKTVYLSKTNDSSYLLPIRSYNIAIRYTDNFNRYKELFFDTRFATKENVTEFLNNFNIKDTEDPSFVKFERYKLIRKICKIILFILFVLAVVGYAIMQSGAQV